MVFIAYYSNTVFFYHVGEMCWLFSFSGFEIAAAFLGVISTSLIVLSLWTFAFRADILFCVAL